MRTIYLLAFVFVVLGVSFLYGSTISEQCVAIDEFKGCWKTIAVSVSSDLCAKSPCIATPEAQQHNAIVDVLLDACQKARNGNYNSQQLNSRIEEVARTFTGYDIDSRTLCDQPGAVLVKRQYGQ